MTEALQNPIVFQCRECREIVGDSFSLVGRLPPLSVFDFLPDVSLSLSSPRKREGGCEYVEIKCKCEETLGRKYVAVTEEMGPCVGKYCLLDDCVTGYQLGDGRAPKVSMSAEEMRAEIVRLQRFCTYLHEIMQETKRRAWFFGK